MRRKASISSSPLSNPSTPIYALASRFQDFLHFPNPDPLYVVMGSLAANMLSGDPVWIMLIGPPSCGKTEILMSLSKVQGVKVESTLTSDAALLSGTKSKEFVSGAKGGLLREIGSKGLVVFKDFTSILSLEAKVLSVVLSAFREIFDEGGWSRRIGGEGGRKLEWKGKLGVFGGVTPEIDRSHAMVAAMGERFIFYRYTESDGWAESRKALERLDMTGPRGEIRDMVKGFFESLDLDWRTSHTPRKLRNSEMESIIALGQFAARCRGVVQRDPYSKEICFVPTAEFPTRVVKELGQLYLGMEFIGVELGEAMRILRKMALDSMPMVRSVVVREIMEGKKHSVTAKEVADRGRFSVGTAERSLEELKSLQVIEKGEKGWGLTDNAWDMVRRGFK